MRLGVEEVLDFPSQYMVTVGKKFQVFAHP